MKLALSSFFSLCTEEIFSISSNLIMQFFFLPSAVKVGKGKEGFILGACRQGICFIPVILIFPFIWGLNGILYAQPIADVLSALITVFMAIPLHRSLAVAEQKMKITASIPCDRQ